MRTAPFVCGLAAAILSATPGIAAASETASTTIAITVQVYSRTALRVSSDQLRFAVGEGDGGAVAAVEFTAGARIPTGTDIVLTVQPVDAIGPSDLAAITFVGTGEGTRAGTLDAGTPATAGRWHGSGLRHGRLVFTLCNARPGAYTVPVRFVLSAP